MGGSESKDSSSDNSTLFNSEERQQIERKFNKIHKSKDDFKNGLSPLNKDVSGRMYDYIINQNKKGHRHGEKHMSLHQFEKFIALSLKGSVTDKAVVIMAMAGQAESVDSEEIFGAVKELVCTYKSFISRLPHWSNIHLSTQDKEEELKRFVLSLMQELLLPGTNQKGEVKRLQLSTGVKYTILDIEGWLSKAPQFLHVFDTVCTGLFRFEEVTEACVHFATTVPIPFIREIQSGPIHSILDMNSVLYLNYNLTSQYQSEWRLLFSNSLYGDSFSQLVSKIINKGPSLIIVKDKNGYIFGGFCSVGWECRAKFYGNSTCFLFTLSPQYGVFTATMYNENFMYLNQGQETLPNGLGMGGQFEYFGFWINSSFNHGHSKAKPRCTTYGSPQLSASPEFEVVAVEVWAVGPEPKKDSDDEDDVDEITKRSILDRDPESKAMLELLGKHQVSEGMRERDDDDDMSEEMKKKMNTIPKLF